ncbi:MAG: TetR/AcrR family transcriptional regulator [Sphingopyxis sp.]|uniref:TetR/AcrR family transcriptional regulator n=1 Tax=Sphingopyxis sp. TaxID=1908224 RepID=UPI002ABBC0A0|nr:TetR/AcrR family transcriptional regulator [Sphingopyxis sp.]MDZ3831178.1 TetR/AcrR family transcriptional regulator [Sphingopyxis sp.]
MPRQIPDDRDETIFRAAREVFAAQGFAAARMDDIAKAAGLSKATLYLHFASKEELFFALTQELIDRMLPVVIPSDIGDVPAPALIRQIIGTAMQQVTRPDVALVPRLVIGEGNRFPDLVAYYQEHAVSRIHHALQTIIEHGVARGEFRAVDARNSARSIMGGIIVTAIWKTVLEPAGADSVDVEAMADAHVAMVLGGLQVEAGAGS